MACERAVPQLKFSIFKFQTQNSKSFGRLRPHKTRILKKEEGPTPTPRRKDQPQLQAREGPTLKQPKRRKDQSPSQEWGDGPLPLHPSQARPSPSGSGLAPPLPFLLAGPLAFPFSLFGWTWLSPLLGRALANPDPKGQPQPQRADPNPKASPCLIFLHPRR